MSPTPTPKRGSKKRAAHSRSGRRPIATSFPAAANNNTKSKKSTSNSKHSSTHSHSHSHPASHHKSTQNQQILVQYTNSPKYYKSLKSHLQSLHLQDFLSLHEQILSEYQLLGQFCKLNGSAGNVAYRHLTQYTAFERFHRIMRQWYHRSPCFCRMIHRTLGTGETQKHTTKDTAAAADAFNPDLTQFYAVTFSSMQGVQFSFRPSSSTASTAKTTTTSTTTYNVGLTIYQDLLNILREVKLLCHLICLCEENQITVYGTLFQKEGSVSRQKDTFLMLGVYSKLYACFKSYLLLLKDAYKCLRKSLKYLPHELPLSSNLHTSATATKVHLFSKEMRFKPVCKLPSSLEEYCGNVLDIVQANHKNHHYRDLPRVEDFLLEYRMRKNEENKADEED